MNPEYQEILKNKMSNEGYEKLIALDNMKLFNFVGKFISHCNPESVYMCDDSAEDEQYVKDMAVKTGEEARLSKKGQTIHYDGYNDQGRDVANTKFMVPKDQLESMKALNCIEYGEGLKDIMGIAEGIMKGKTAIVKLFCEGPTFSEFSRPCVQITDSWYVCHSEQLLYRSAYEHFRQMKNKDDFYRFIHSAGELDERGCTVNLNNRRIFMDCENMIVYSMNDQYAGNSIGLKKHAMRLAIKDGSKKGWLCEHMFVMGCINNEKNRSTYFCGAYPSACGKTATAMLPGEKVVGDDIAYFKNLNGEFRAVNVEQGIFGIIKDVNQKDDPVIYKTLQEEKEMIFSNVLTGPDNNPYWLGMGIDTPSEGANHSGPGWFEGKKDSKGNTIPLAHSNARYTIRLDYLDNIDPSYEDKNGVIVGGVIYGGRDSDTSVPVEESADWEDGILMKACTLESETTSATIGKEGVLKPNPMANIEFVSYPLGEYIQNNLDFVKGMKEIPKIFAVNYFLRNEKGDFCTSKLAKKVWLHWAEKRVHGEVEGYKTPTGIIPKFDDIAPMFKDMLGETYTKADYEYQFQFRCGKWIAKLNRAIEYFKKNAPDTADPVFKKWEDSIKKIEDAKIKYGDIIKPGEYKG